MNDAHISRYLHKHAEPQTITYAGRVTHPYARSVVIPTYDEISDCISNVFRHIDASDTLVIAVVNAPDNADPAPLARTRTLLNEISNANPQHLLVVDCVSPGSTLAAKSGVGLARKLGTDIALQLYVDDKIGSPWIYQTDADAVLPADYFSTKLCGAGAVVFGHTHVSSDPHLACAARLYDLHMTHYLNGIRAAGSSYAYPTLGSTIVVHARAYASVRGYPKRNAGEDFYLLNKIAKVANVVHQPKTQVELQARASSRVPFGTGPALAKIFAGLESDPTGQFYLSYHPASFTLLAQALTYLENFAADLLVPSDLSANTEKIAAILSTLRFDKVRLTIAGKYDSTERRREILQQWFDAAKTLRFIHEARRFYADQPLLEILGKSANPTGNSGQELP
jgi:hypothetical protein